MSPSFVLPDTASLGDLRTYLGRAGRVENGSVRLIASSGVLAVYTAVLYPAGLLDEAPTVLGLRTFELAEPADLDVVVPIESFAERLRRLAERLQDDSAEGGGSRSGTLEGGDPVSTDDADYAYADPESDADDDDADTDGDGDGDDDTDTDTTDIDDDDIADDADDADDTDDTDGTDDTDDRDDSPEDVSAAEWITVELPLQVNTVTWAAISPPRGGWIPLPDLDVTVLRDQARVGIAEVAETIPTASGDAVVRRVRSEVWGRPIAQSEHVPAGAAFAAEALGFLQDGDRVRLFETGPWSRLTTSRGHVLVKRRAWALSS